MLIQQLKKRIGKGSVYCLSVISEFPMATVEVQ